ncbi:DUF4192 domain-containing protein [Gordonia sp. PKS22-38]|uniref:DUF4192 domain-containing protein n=1 Tax=Gordonia prachuapensis TaxID=3115651 RepID=A0ABU7MRH0_9ACTN|nr:DUF4192 domain-containing protein [Gordonia sp. PKS22-38]
MSPSARSRPLHPSALLTALPGMIGFIPERSLILLAFGDDPGTINTSMRHDLILDENGELVDALVSVLDGLADVCLRNEVRSVVAVVVDDRHPISDARYRRVCEVADARFAAVGGICAGFVVGTVAENARWQRVWVTAGAAPSISPVSPSDLSSGRIGDPHTSPTAVRRTVRTGRRVLAHREEMEEMLRPLPHCVGPHDGGGSPARLRVVDDPDDGVLLREILDQVLARAVPSAVPDLDCATVTRLGEALLRLPVRDAAMSFADTDLRHAAESLWRELARRLTGRSRASAATMLAYQHYVDGEGGYAGVALDCALNADPEWSLAILLDRALRGGLPPDSMRAMIPMCRDVATTLGVVMPDPSVEREVG